MKLYHYTCAHSAAMLRKDPVLKPHTQVQLDGRPLIWFTDLDEPDPVGLGLTSVHIRCDRTEWRAVVDVDAERWPDYVRRQSAEFRRDARWLVGPGALPMHWYVTRWPVRVDELRPVEA